MSGRAWVLVTIVCICAVVVLLALLTNFLLPA